MPRRASPLAICLLAVIALASACGAGDRPASDDERSMGDAGDVDGSVAATDGGGDSSLEEAGPPPLGDCPMGPSPNLAADAPRILVIAPASSLAPTSSDAERLVQHLQGLFAGDTTFTAPEVVLQLTSTSTDSSSGSLVGFWYSPGGRDARIASLAGPFTWVVMLDDAKIALYYPELHFEGVRVVACRARAAGAKPIVLQTWTSTATDTAARGEIAYRVGNGTGTPVVPAGYAWAAAWEAMQSDAGAQLPGHAGAEHPQIPVGGPPPAAAFVAAASVYSAITGKSAATTTYQPAGITAAAEARLAAAAQDAVVTHATISHYTAPFASVVQRRTMQPQPELLFMSSGTSSEALWYDRMNDVVPKLGMTPRGTAIGSCNDTKTFDAACLDKAKASFGSAQYRILFARDYSVSSATTVAAGTQNDLQVQVWDRHFDQDPADGAAAVASLVDRSRWVIDEARSLGLAWIPHHLAFAKLKTARPSVQLTSDGTHVTYPVGYALAAMSVESRTSLQVPTAGLDADTAAAVGFADETIRQLSSLSQWGTYVADDPTTRPKVP